MSTKKTIAVLGLSVVLSIAAWLLKRYAYNRADVPTTPDK